MVDQTEKWGRLWFLTVLDCGLAILIVLPIAGMSNIEHPLLQALGVYFILLVPSAIIWLLLSLTKDKGDKQDRIQI